MDKVQREKIAGIMSEEALVRSALDAVRRALSVDGWELRNKRDMEHAQECLKELAENWAGARDERQAWQAGNAVQQVVESVERYVTLDAYAEYQVRYALACLAEFHKRRVKGETV